MVSELYNNNNKICYKKSELKIYDFHCNLISVARTEVVFACIPIVEHSAYKMLSSAQSLSHVQLFATPWIAARQTSLSITNYRSLLKLMSIESVMLSSHLILCHPLLLLPPIPPSISVFSNESAHRWPKYEFQLQHQSFQWTPRTDLL